MAGGKVAGGLGEASGARVRRGIPLPTSRAGLSFNGQGGGWLSEGRTHFSEEAVSKRQYWHLLSCEDSLNNEHETKMKRATIDRPLQRTAGCSWVWLLRARVVGVCGV